MLDHDTIPDQKPLRPASTVMRLRRMGAMFPTRLSFLRSLMRKLSSDGAKLTRPVWDICANGYGHAVYSIDLGGHTYSLISVSNNLDPSMRTDRVIAEAWDSAYCLFDGIPTDADIARVVSQAPLQEAGRFAPTELVLSRANKSVRLFDHVAQALRAGEQPDRDLIGKTGYLMRTTAVYGNGKFGIADRSRIAGREGLSGPFAVEMLTVWMIRNFTHDLVEHVGQGTLDRDLKRHLGIGNSTGLGMAPFLVSHPMLLDAWMQVRETAIARVRALETLSTDKIEELYGLCERVAQHLAEWQVPDEIAQSRIDTLRAEWPAVVAMMTPDFMTSQTPLDRLLVATEQWSVDTQELVVSMCLEPFGDLIDGLCDCMSTPFTPVLDPRADCAAIRADLETHAQWALDTDYACDTGCGQFWYVSEEKLEPRLGNRHAEDGSELESPLDIGRRFQALHTALDGQTGPLGAFLADHPEHRFAARRIQTLARHPYSEIRDNMIASDCLPIDMLRCKLSFFGASKFDPKSDRWTRITLAQGAPLPDELDDADDWWLPTFAG